MSLVGDVLKRHGVQVYFCGHVHDLEHLTDSGKTACVPSLKVTFPIADYRICLIFLIWGIFDQCPSFC